MTKGTTATISSSSPSSVLLPMSIDQLNGTRKPGWNVGASSTF